jgi:hypothetical protein
LIYFMVNNNYQLLDVYEHCKNLKSYDISLIQIPHTLDIVAKHSIFARVYTFESPFKGLMNALNIANVRMVEKDIEKSLIFTERDTLFFYTEYEVLNQFVIRTFKAVGGLVYLIEDGGLPTYLTYGVKSNAKLNIRERLKLFYFNYVVQYDFVEFLKYNNVIFPQINEKYIDGVLLYLDVSIVRNIKKHLISRSRNDLKLDESKAIFLNEKMYNSYCSKEEYRLILEDCFKKMINNFNKVYFKFHPRESESNKLWQLEILAKYPSIELISDNAPIEKLLEEYQAKYIFSFLSAALLNINALGGIPVYLYPLYEQLSKNVVFKKLDSILTGANYSFIGNDFDVANVGFGDPIQGEAVELRSLVV